MRHQGLAQIMGTTGNPAVRRYESAAVRLMKVAESCCDSPEASASRMNSPSRKAVDMRAMVDTTTMQE